MSIATPPLIHWKRDCRNGHTPAAQFYQRAVESMNHLTAYGGREVFHRAWEPTTVGWTGTTNLARFRFRSKYGASRLTFVVIMSTAASVSAANPRCEIAVTIAGGATTTLDPIYYGLDDVGTLGDVPSEWYVAERTATIASATTYEVLVSVIDYANILGITAYEQSDTTIVESTNYYSGLVPAAGVPIYDAHRERLLAGLSNMYRQNAGTLWHWGLYDGGNRSDGLLVKNNLVDDTSSGTPTPTQPGVYLNNAYRRTASRTTVPYEFAVYAGGSGTVYLVDSGGTDRASIVFGGGGAAWSTTTASLPAADTFYAVQYHGTGVAQIDVGAVSLIEWES
jgi:hypothetical protein